MKLFIIGLLMIAVSAEEQPQQCIKEMEDMKECVQERADKRWEDKLKKHEIAIECLKKSGCSISDGNQDKRVSKWGCIKDAERGLMKDVTSCVERNFPYVYAISDYSAGKRHWKKCKREMCSLYDEKSCDAASREKAIDCMNEENVPVIPEIKCKWFKEHKSWRAIRKEREERRAKNGKSAKREKNKRPHWLQNKCEDETECKKKLSEECIGVYKLQKAQACTCAQQLAGSEAYNTALDACVADANEVTERLTEKVEILKNKPRPCQTEWSDPCDTAKGNRTWW